MAYSTGSGDYVALMAAVLTHAIADGWTTTGGTWPISKGNVRGVNWSTFTIAEADFSTLGGANRTVRYIRIAVGTSPADATANAALDANSAIVPNMDRTFTNWWIFSDPGVGKPDYIHVVVRFSNGITSDCYGHFSFGEINKHGMTHTGVAYATSQYSRAYAVGVGSSFETTSARDWNDCMYSKQCLAFSGFVGRDSSPNNFYQSLAFIIDGTVSPVPASGGWPAVNTVAVRLNALNVTHFGSGSQMRTSLGRTIFGSASNTAHLKMSTWPYVCLPQPYSGALSLGNLPLIVTNGTGSTSSCMMLGSFPDVYTASVESYAPEDEVTFNSETYKIFPFLRKTPFTDVGVSGAITSGPGAFAYKKVV